MKTTICLIRHGQTNWNKEHLIQGRTDIPLNETGKSQLLNTAINLQKLNISWDVLISSPLARAKTSCEIIKEVLCIKEEIIVKENLTEREFGKADGLFICDEVYEKILNDDYQGMEKADEIKERAKNIVLAIQQEFKGKNILIVTHSHLIKAFFLNYDKNLTFKSYLGNGNVSFVEFEDDEISSLTFNKRV